jgi:Protein of unknown function (DUF3108)
MAARARGCWILCVPLLIRLANAQTLHYTGEWRFLEAGRVEVNLGANGARMEVVTAGLADRLYPVRDSYSVTYDHSLCASASLEDARQGKQHRQIAVTFGAGKAARVERDMLKNGDTVSTAAVETPHCVHDILGALEKLRRTVVGPGGRLALPMTDGKKSAGVEVQVQERETIRTPAGVFTAIRCEAMLFNGVIFRRKARLFVWLTDDARRLPVQIRVQMPFYLGSVTLQLQREGPG